MSTELGVDDRLVRIIENQSLIIDIKTGVAVMR